MLAKSGRQVFLIESFKEDTRLNPADSADIELDLLIQLFYDDPDRLGRFQELKPEEVPDPSHQLLVHNKHMTVTVEKYHRSPVDVNVLQTRRDGDRYSRKIVLTSQSDNQAVMFGIVRLDLSVLSPNVRLEIEKQQSPLGRILINHNVLRVVKLLNLFHVDPGEDLTKSLKLELGQTCHGRTALIFCDGAPAIELLEIVAQ